ncbi:MAG: hypothetical protein NUW37_17995 [Planctomycetes bacterium]|nr:hypothetical protein [Planctomycetota bacterium]MCR4318239.1 hypothetical protein [Planctomycetota bacterium]
MVDTTIENSFLKKLLFGALVIVTAVTNMLESYAAGPVSPGALWNIAMLFSRFGFLAMVTSGILMLFIRYQLAMEICLIATLMMWSTQWWFLMGFIKGIIGGSLSSILFVIPQVLLLVVLFVSIKGFATTDDASNSNSFR